MHIKDTCNNHSCVSKMVTANRKSLSILGITLPIALIALFLLFPVISVFITGFKDETGFTFSYLRAVLSDTFYYKIFAFTLAQAILSTIVSLLIGIPIGYLFGKYNFPGRKVLLIFFTVPFVLPSVLVGMGFLIIFGEDGLFGAPILSIILAHAFYNIPLVVHYFSSYYQNFDRDLIGAAKTLGSKKFHLFARVYVPIFIQPLLTAALLTFIFCFLSYGIILILGALSLFRTTETQIYSEYLSNNANVAAILALLQLLVMIAFVIGYLIFTNKRAKKEKSGTTETIPLEKINFKEFLKKPSGIFLGLVFVFGLLLELAPLISILIRAPFIAPIFDPLGNGIRENSLLDLLNTDITTSARITLVGAILNTLKFAFGSATLASVFSIITVIALSASKRKHRNLPLELLTYLPIAISSTTLSLGIMQTFANIPLFTNHPTIFIMISHALLGYPFITRALLNGLNTIDPDIIDSSKTLGANWFYKLRKIYIPLLFPSFIAGFTFALGLSIGEFTTVNFFAINYDNIATLTVVLYRLRSVRKFALASAVGTILLLISYFSFFAIESLGAREKTKTKI
ncbi:MAG: iron ABC transporter permease [Asgard group archaeon]|nr:iron ABC transporter permease [Asgard group archaeon]